MAVTRLGCFTQDALDGLPQKAPPTTSSATMNQTIVQPYDPSTGQRSIFRVDGQVKFFNRRTTADASSGGNEDPFAVQAKSEFSDTNAGHACMEATVDWKAAGVTGGGVRGVQGVARLAATFTMTGGSVIGTYGQAANLGTMNGSGIMMAGVYGLLEDGGTFTAVSHVAAGWFDSHLTKTITAGSSQLLYLTNNGTTTLNSVFFVYPGNKITNLFEIDPTDTGMVSALTAGAVSAITNWRTIACKVHGEDGFLIFAGAVA